MPSGPATASNSDEYWSARLSTIGEEPVVVADEIGTPAIPEEPDCANASANMEIVPKPKPRTIFPGSATRLVSSISTTNGEQLTPADKQLAVAVAGVVGRGPHPKPRHLPLTTTPLIGGTSANSMAPIPKPRKLLLSPHKIQGNGETTDKATNRESFIYQNNIYENIYEDINFNNNITDTTFGSGNKSSSSMGIGCSASTLNNLNGFDSPPPATIPQPSSRKKSKSLTRFGKDKDTDLATDPAATPCSSKSFGFCIIS